MTDISYTMAIKTGDSWTPVNHQLWEKRSPVKQLIRKLSSKSDSIIKNRENTKILNILKGIDENFLQFVKDTEQWMIANKDIFAKSSSGDSDNQTKKSGQSSSGYSGDEKSASEKIDEISKSSQNILSGAEALEKRNKSIVKVTSGIGTVENDISNINASIYNTRLFKNTIFGKIFLKTKNYVKNAKEDIIYGIKNAGAFAVLGVGVGLKILWGLVTLVVGIGVTIVKKIAGWFWDFFTTPYGFAVTMIFGALIKKFGIMAVGEWAEREIIAIKNWLENNPILKKIKGVIFPVLRVLKDWLLRMTFKFIARLPGVDTAAILKAVFSSEEEKMAEQTSSGLSDTSANDDIIHTSAGLLTDADDLIKRLNYKTVKVGTSRRQLERLATNFAAKTGNFWAGAGVKGTTKISPSEMAKNRQFSLYFRDSSALQKAGDTIFEFNLKHGGSGIPVISNEAYDSAKEPASQSEVDDFKKAMLLKATTDAGEALYELQMKQKYKLLTERGEKIRVDNVNNAVNEIVGKMDVSSDSIDALNARLQAVHAVLTSLRKRDGHRYWSSLKSDRHRSFKYMSFPDDTNEYRSDDERRLEDFHD